MCKFLAHNLLNPQRFCQESKIDKYFVGVIDTGRRQQLLKPNIRQVISVSKLNRKQPNRTEEENMLRSTACLFLLMVKSMRTRSPKYVPPLF
jgi:hypothetical protein